MENNIWIERMRDLNKEALWPTGFAGAIIGITESKDGPRRFIIDGGAVVQILIDDHDMSADDAWEYYGYNIEGAHMGENEPVYRSKLWDE